jgi:hypothetical protein
MHDEDKVLCHHTITSPIERRRRSRRVSRSFEKDPHQRKSVCLSCLKPLSRPPAHPDTYVTENPKYVCHPVFCCSVAVTTVLPAHDTFVEPLVGTML